MSLYVIDFDIKTSSKDCVKCTACCKRACCAKMREAPDCPKSCPLNDAAMMQLLVLLIEAGGDEPTASSVPAWVTAYWGREDTDWMYQTEPQNACLNEGGKCSWPRGKMLGGCSVINGMMYMRGHAADYDGWAVNGAAGWSWRDVFPYFLKSEDNRNIGSGISPQYHSKGGPLPVQRFRHAPQFAHDVVAAGIELGYPPTSDLNGESITGFTLAQALNDEGSRYSTARAYLRPAARRENLDVLLNAHVTRVLFAQWEKRATGVQYLRDGETKEVKATKEVILSAGTINSPQILLLSGVGPKEALEGLNIPVVHDLPGVGQNLHNHIGVSLDFTLEKEPDNAELNWATAMEYMLSRNGPMSSTGMSQLTGIVNSKLAGAGGRHPDVQFFFGGYYAGCGDETIHEEPDNPDRRHVTIAAIALQPRSRGYLTLRSAEPLDPPILQPNYFLEEHDMNVVMDAARIAFRLANTTILREKYGMTPTPGHGGDCGEVEDGLTDEFLKCLIRYQTAPENHQVGTCKMGPSSDPVAVVDVDLKVHGIEGLRVIDASIMPTVPTGNTAAPTIMVAERGSEFIVTRYQRSKTQQTLASRFGGVSDPSFGNQLTTQNGEGQTDSPDERWKPWEKNWHFGHPWQHKSNSGFQHDEQWHKKHSIPLSNQRYDHNSR
ncbi:Glucose dehydrogenase [Eumeta japonica]|uniref:Glucose dehydrogenase n=1 Tax=Eumeta variegata TaxID=151549 RepID=A0A4C1XPE7_EUMVA|nr:Glucose dehydrogenase [Eumeta japonica]